MNTKTLCLGVLSLGRASGYDIGKQLEQIFGHFVDCSPSGVYPALKMLHEEGLVQYENIEQDSLPNKKIFELTEKGKEKLQEELEVLPPTHKVRSQFMLLLFFAEWLSTDRLASILKERSEELECFFKDEAYWRKQLAENAGQSFLLDYVATKFRAEKEFLDSKSDGVLSRLNGCNKAKLGEVS